MQESMDLFVKVCDDFGFSIFIKKVEVMYQLVFVMFYIEFNIIVKGQRFVVVDKFVFFGSILLCFVNIDEEVVYRIVRVSVVFGRQKDQVWECWGLRIEIKLKGQLFVYFFFMYVRYGLFIVGMLNNLMFFI